MHPAEVLKFPPLVVRTRLPDVVTSLKGNGRKIAVAKFRELANKIESGELDGARVQWRDDNGEETEMVTVTISRSAPRNGKRVSELPGGVVQLITTTIEEEY